ncbi:MAG: DNA/RNA non-specific endonuclease [Bdellovibrionaceae bacterium]|nr:DNA/RNA non-specific endonuclease [Pseudobdellovibrionaceae bacterium]
MNSRLLFVLLALMVGCTTQPTRPPEPTAPRVEQQKLPVPSTGLEVPSLRTGEHPVQKAGYAVLFDKSKRVARWVAYRLNKSTAFSKVAERSNDFHVDGDVESCPDPDEYKHTGYDRGHLFPAEDARWSPEAMYDSFSMANMTPQSASMNRGSWKRIESQVRGWSAQHDEVYVVAGPILSEPCLKTIGRGICVPKRHFKVVLEKDGDQFKGVGFIVAQDDKGDITKFVHSVAEVEKVTGIDFFPALPDEIEKRVEATASLDEWSAGSHHASYTRAPDLAGGSCPAGTTLQSATIHGCCSGHGGVAGPKKWRACCGDDKKVLCNDGTKSRGCRCD